MFTIISPMEVVKTKIIALSRHKDYILGIFKHLWYDQSDDVSSDDFSTQLNNNAHHNITKRQTGSNRIFLLNYVNGAINSHFSFCLLFSRGEVVLTLQ